MKDYTRKTVLGQVASLDEFLQRWTKPPWMRRVEPGSRVVLSAKSATFAEHPDIGIERL